MVKVDKTKKKLEDSIVQKLLEGEKSFASMSRFERYEYAYQAMQLVRDYCCHIQNMDPASIDLGFIKLKGTTDGLCFYEPTKDGLSEHYYVMLHDSIPLISTPQEIFETVFHEMKHVQKRQQRVAREGITTQPGIKTSSTVAVPTKPAGKGVPEESPTHSFAGKVLGVFSGIAPGTLREKVSSLRTLHEDARDYSYTKSKIVWYGDPEEREAETFALSQMRKFSKAAMLKQKGPRVSFAKNYLTSTVMQIGANVEYAATAPISEGIVLYNLFAKTPQVKALANQSPVVSGCYYTSCLTLGDIEVIAAQNPEIFHVRDFERLEAEALKQQALLLQQQAAAGQIPTEANFATTDETSNSQNIKTSEHQNSSPEAPMTQTQIDAFADGVAATILTPPQTDAQQQDEEQGGEDESYLYPNDVKCLAEIRDTVDGLYRYKITESAKQGEIPQEEYEIAKHGYEYYQENILEAGGAKARMHSQLSAAMHRRREPKPVITKGGKPGQHKGDSTVTSHTKGTSSTITTQQEAETLTQPHSEDAITSVTIALVSPQEIIDAKIALLKQKLENKGNKLESQKDLLTKEILSSTLSGNNQVHIYKEPATKQEYENYLAQIKQEEQQSSSYTSFSGKDQTSYTQSVYPPEQKEEPLVYETPRIPPWEQPRRPSEIKNSPDLADHNVEEYYLPIINGKVIGDMPSHLPNIVKGENIYNGEYYVQEVGRPELYADPGKITLSRPTMAQIIKAEDIITPDDNNIYHNDPYSDPYLEQ